ncbi:hypothetical protein BBP40_008226 [Aspergillus hancockii]|nr:hypothetical protein BBP40_008226 [Aspergillus hancockii]
MATLNLRGSATGTVCLFANLPCEIITMIFENLSDFEDLFAMILTCKQFMQLFKGDQYMGNGLPLDDSLMHGKRSKGLSEIQDISVNMPSEHTEPPQPVNAENNSNAKIELIEGSANRSRSKIVRSVFSNIYCTACSYHDNVNDRNAEKGSIFMIWQICSATQKVLIPRQNILDIFETWWQFLKRRHLEEVLIPIGVRLALSLENCKSEAVKFLETIASGSYGWATEIPRNGSRLTLSPLLECKANPQGKAFEPFDARHGDLDECALAVIQPNRIYLSLDKTPLPPCGLSIQKNSIRVRFSSVLRFTLLAPTRKLRHPKTKVESRRHQEELERLWRAERTRQYMLRLGWDVHWKASPPRHR